jgi:hypothetical protein
MAPISITLIFDTPEQAQHVLEAYGEARGMTSPSIPAFIPTAGNGSAQAADNSAANPSIPTFTPGTASGGVTGASASPNGASAAAQQNTSHASTTEVDARGVPWHADYHSSSKKQARCSTPTRRLSRTRGR